MAGWGRVPKQMVMLGIRYYVYMKLTQKNREHHENMPIQIY